MSYNIEAHMAIRMAKLKIAQSKEAKEAKEAKEIDMDMDTTSDKTSAYFNSTRASRGSVIKKEGK